MKWSSILRSRVLFWILVVLAGFLFVEWMAKEILYHQALYRSYKLSASYYQIDSGFWAFKREYEKAQQTTVFRFYPIITDRYGRHYYHPSATGHQYGFLGREPPVLPPPGTIRILCVGSSIVEMGFPAPLQELLDKSHPGRYEVINAGIPATPTQGLLMNYVSLWFRLRPHILVVDDNVDSVTRNALRSWGLEEVAGEGNDVLDDMAEAFLPRTGLALVSLVRWNLKYNLNWLSRVDEVKPQGLDRSRSLLTGLLALAAGSGTQPILVTYQPSLSLDEADLRGYSREFIEQAVSYYNAMFYTHTVEGVLKVLKAHNDILRDLSTTMAIPLVDVDGRIPREDSSYVDGTHYSKSASAIIAHHVAEVILSLPDPFQGPSTPLLATREDCDVLVIGGGLAGLAAAAELPPSYRVLVLEKERSLGGRVATVKQDGIVVEMGASHTWEDSEVDAYGIQPSDVVELEGPMGLFLDGRLVWCESPMECVHDLGLSPEATTEVQAFAARQLTDPSQLGPEALRIVNGLYKAEHPDETISGSDPRVRRKAFRRIPPRFNRLGNRRLPEELARYARVNPLLGAEVTRVTESPLGARVSFRQGGQDRVLTARRVIIATTAPQALGMLKIDEDRIRPLLEDVRYHSIIVVGLAFKGIDPPVGFTQIVTPDLPATTIFRTPSSAPDEPVITMFFGADTYAELSPKRDEEIISLARQILRQSGAMSFHDEQVTFQRVQRWEQGTVKRSASVAAAEKSGPVVVKDRIFLAGDYLCPMGSVGMNCAVWSGQQAARAVVESFRIENSTQQD